MKVQTWVEDLGQIVSPQNMKVNESLKKYTMTKLGGVADVFITPSNEEEAIAVIRYAAEKDIPILMLGNGSNMVVRDGGVRGIVIHFNKLDKIEVQGTTIYAEAGALLIDVSKAAAKHCLTGFGQKKWAENLCSALMIPILFALKKNMKIICVKVLFGSV